MTRPQSESQEYKQAKTPMARIVNPCQKRCINADRSRERERETILTISKCTAFDLTMLCKSMRERQRERETERERER